MEFLPYMLENNKEVERRYRYYVDYNLDKKEDKIKKEWN
jgi:hypothetical protein